MAIINATAEFMGIKTDKAYASFEGSEITKQIEYAADDTEKLNGKKIYNYFVKYFVYTDNTKKYFIRECKCFKKLDDLSVINADFTDNMILEDIGSGVIE